MIPARGILFSAFGLVAAAACTAALASPGVEGLHSKVAPAATPPPPVPEPNAFQGSVTIDGRPAPDGTRVEAVANNESCAVVSTVGGRYALTVQVHECGSPGVTVYFWVDGHRATEAAVLFSPNIGRTLDLTVAPVPPRLLGVSTGCSSESSGRAVITFLWDGGQGDAQWLDLSLFDNGFQPGTFIGAGPVAVSSTPSPPSSFTWDGLLPRTLHLWRVNMLEGGQWASSETGSFTTPDCGYPSGPAATQLRIIRQYCASYLGEGDPGTRSVTFGWLTAGRLTGGRTPEGVFWDTLVPPDEQWIDISVFDNGFAPGTFVGVKPRPDLGREPHADASMQVPGILAGVRHYWRVNSRFGDEWVPSATQYFDGIYCAGQGG